MSSPYMVCARLIFATTVPANGPSRRAIRERPEGKREQHGLPLGASYSDLPICNETWGQQTRSPLSALVSVRLLSAFFSTHLFSTS